MRAIVGMIGPNGAGKTTIIDTFAGLLRPRSGSINLLGTDIHRVSAYKIAETVAYVRAH